MFTHPFIREIAGNKLMAEEASGLGNLRRIWLRVRSRQQTCQNIGIDTDTWVAFSRIGAKVVRLVEIPKHRLNAHITAQETQDRNRLGRVIAIGQETRG